MHYQVELKALLNYYHPVVKLPGDIFLHGKRGNLHDY